MYVVTQKKPDEAPVVNPTLMPEIIMPSQAAREALAPENLRGVVDGIEKMAEDNKEMQQFIEAKDSGKPGHYYGRDIMIEGRMPLAAFLLTPLEYGDDTEWFKNDRLFQDFMNRHPIYSWLRR